VLTDGIPILTVDGETNPHVWSIRRARRDHFVPVDASARANRSRRAADYEARADAYATDLHKPTRNFRHRSRRSLRRTGSWPFHDAFPYFAKHYGFELVGVILQNPGQEPSAADLAALVATVKAAGVPAVFSESQFSPKLAQTLADEAGISKVVTDLYTDSLGAQPADTYEGMMRWDMQQVVEALQ
jgi:ABC-type Zn uptake system ZnuABC Zn-binding protein ZnuA